LAIFILALGARLALLALLGGNPLFDTPILDSRFYLEAGRAIAEGAGLPSRPFFMSPGYTGFVAAFSFFFSDPRQAIVVAQVILNALACVLLTVAGGRLFGRFAGCVAGVLLCLHGPAIFGSTRLLAESPAVFLVSVLLLVLPRGEREATPRRILAASFVLGLLGLLRSNALLFAPFLAVGLLPRRQKGWIRLAAWRLGACVIGTAAALAPATLHNIFVGGEPVLVSSSGGVNFYIGNAPDADGRFVSLNNLVQASGRFKDDTTHGSFERSVQAFAEESAGHPLKASEVSAFWFGLAFEGIAREPLRWAGLLLRKTYLFLNAFEIPQVDNMYFLAQSLPFPGAVLAETSRVIWPLGLVGCLLLLRPGAPARLGLLLFVAFSVSVVIFFVTGRHRLPVAPLLCAFAGLAVDRLVGLARAGDRRRLAGLIALVLGAALLCNLNPTLGGSRSSGGLFSIPEEYLGYANQHNSLAGLLLEREQFDAAAAEARKGLAIMPGHPPALHLKLAQALMGLGDNAGAIVVLERGLERHPEHPRMATVLGSLRFKKGDAPGARSVLEKAVRIDPGIPRAWNTLGLARYELGEAEGGLAALQEAIRLAPRWAEPRLNLALMLARLGRTAEAAAEVRFVLQSDPSNEPARRILDSLEAILERAPGKEGSSVSQPPGVRR
jgi:tetratricopeptide (TPR) repeat protein